jgi:hypothetical protein
MPQPKEGRDSKLIALFLSVYEDGSWAGDLSIRERPEAHADRGVDTVATRKSDGLVLAIEHTLIEPFPGDKDDYYQHFKPLQDKLRADDSFRVPGFVIHVEMPPGALPHGSDWRGIADDITGWVRANQSSFPADAVVLPCPTPHHPSGTLQLRVRRVSLGDSAKTFPLNVQRFGEMRVGDSVEKALRDKLPKLTSTKADRRLLMLERDQGWVTPELVRSEVDRLRGAFPALSSVDELWIMDTAAFGERDVYVAFDVVDALGRNVERLEFYGGKLFLKFKNERPVFIGAPGE